MKGVYRRRDNHSPPGLPVFSAQRQKDLDPDHVIGGVFYSALCNQGFTFSLHLGPRERSPVELVLLTSIICRSYCSCFLCSLLCTFAGQLEQLVLDLEDQFSFLFQGKEPVQARSVGAPLYTVDP